VRLTALVVGDLWTDLVLDLPVLLHRLPCKVSEGHSRWQVEHLSVVVVHPYISSPNMANCTMQSAPSASISPAYPEQMDLTMSARRFTVSLLLTMWSIACCNR